MEVMINIVKSMYRMDLRETKLEANGEIYISLSPNDELRDLYTSPDVVSVIKFRRILSSKHVACMEEMVKRTRIFS
jgi:hypothetical protein